MTLETIFYLLAITYIIVNLIVVIGIVVGLWLLYRQLHKTIKEIELTVKTELNLEKISLQSLKVAYPTLVSGALSWVVRSVSKKILQRVKTKTQDQNT